MKTNNKDTFILRSSWYEAIKLLSSDSKAEILDAFFKFHIDGEIIEFKNNEALMVFNMAKNSLEYNKKKYITAKKNGSQGGAPFGNKNAEKQPKTTEV